MFPIAQQGVATQSCQLAVEAFGFRELVREVQGPSQVKLQVLLQIEPGCKLESPNVVLINN